MNSDEDLKRLIRQGSKDETVDELNQRLTKVVTGTDNQARQRQRREIQETIESLTEKIKKLDPEKDRLFLDRVSNDIVMLSDLLASDELMTETKFSRQFGGYN